MLLLPLIFFSASALGGIIMAVMRFAGRPLPPLPLAILHGVLAVGGLISLIVYISSRVVPSSAVVAFILFFIAATGGVLLFSMHLKKKPLPIPLIILHALAAIAGYITLLLTFFR